MKFILEARGKNADHTLMPRLIEQHETKVIGWIDGLQCRLRAVLHIRFNAAPFAIECVQFCGDLHGSRRIISQQAIDAQAHVIQSARSIQTRYDAKAQVPVSYTHLTLPTIYSV